MAFYFVFLKWGLSLNPVFTVWLDWLAREFWASAYLSHHLQHEFTDIHQHAISLDLQGRHLSSQFPLACMSPSHTLSMKHYSRCFSVVAP